MCCRHGKAPAPAAARTLVITPTSSRPSAIAASRPEPLHMEPSRRQAELGDMDAARTRPMTAEMAPEVLCMPRARTHARTADGRSLGTRHAARSTQHAAAERCCGLTCGTILAYSCVCAALTGHGGRQMPGQRCGGNARGHVGQSPVQKPSCPTHSYTHRAGPARCADAPMRRCADTPSCPNEQYRLEQ